MTKGHTKLFTVGYEGLDIDDFVDFLSRKKIKRIIDVRKNPISRKKGFSKNKLAAALAEKKIDYVHFPKLGTPSAWRKLEQKHLITREKMFRDFDEQIIPAAQDDIATIRNLLREKNSALMCFEADHSDCHRDCVAREIEKQEKGKVELVHLESAPSTEIPFRK